MNAFAIIDALFCISKNTQITKISDCVEFDQDLSPQLTAAGIYGAVLAPCPCLQCPSQWNCADRKTQEVSHAVMRNPKQLRGLASYDPLRIGDSLRWIDEAVSNGYLTGAYAQAEGCVSGLDAGRMYPLYGMCAKLRAPVVLDFGSREGWQHHRPEVEVLAADFPELNILLAPPPGTDATAIIRLLQRFPHISFLLSPQALVASPHLCEYVELQGRERVAFCARPLSWTAAVEKVEAIPLREETKHFYLFENAANLFGFPIATSA